MNRIKLFDENVSPYQKRLRLMELSGMKLSENQKKKLKPRTESVSPEEDEIDLEEILKEMGYSDEEEDLTKLTNYRLIDSVSVIGFLLTKKVSEINKIKSREVKEKIELDQFQNL